MADTTVLADAPIPKTGDAPVVPAVKDVPGLLDQKPEAIPPAAGDNKPPADPAAKPPVVDPAKPVDAKPVGAPEKYADPKLPETLMLAPEIRTELDTVAKSLNLSQDQYQKIVDIGAKVSEQNNKQSLDHFGQIKQEWHDATMKELGAKATEILADAALGIDHVFKDNPADAKEFRELIDSKNGNGMSNHRLMVKFASFIGRMVKEDTVVNTQRGGGSNKSGKTQAEIMYPDLPRK